MSTRLIWSKAAQRDMQRLHAFLAHYNREAAQQALNAIADAAEQLEALPLLGRPMEDCNGRRELTISFAAAGYNLRYRMHANGNVVILRIYHQKESR